MTSAAVAQNRLRRSPEAGVLSGGVCVTSTGRIRTELMIAWRASGKTQRPRVEGAAVAGARPIYAG